MALCTGILGFVAGLATALIASLILDVVFVPPVFQLDPAFFRLWASLSALAIGTHIVERSLMRMVRRRIKPALGVHGRLDGVANGELYGWAFDADHPDTPVTVSIYLQGRPALNLSAVHYRPDVELSLGCSGKYGFYLNLAGALAEEVVEGSPITAEVRLQNQVLLANAPLIFPAPALKLRKHQPTVIFMHIPKTAGSAFREAISANFLQSEMAYLYATPPGFLVSDLRSLPLEQRRALRLVIGHFQFGIHDSLPNDSEYVTVVREPSARVLSQYLFLRETCPQAFLDAQGRSRSLQHELENHSPHFDNVLVRCFSGIGEDDLPPGSVCAETLDIAVNNLKRHFHVVGHQEQSDAAFAKLCNRYDWNATEGLKPVNVTRQLNELFANQDLIAAIRHYNRWDLKFYEEVLKLYPLVTGQGDRVIG